MVCPRSRPPLSVRPPAPLSIAAAAALSCLPRPARAADPDASAYETVVVAAPVAEATAERHVDARTIATTPRSSADDLLRLVPGLLVTRHGAEGKGKQLFLRGFDAVHGADVEVTVEDVPWNEASNVHGQGYLDLQTLIPEAVVALDAAKGAFRLDQGPFATAGSVRFSLGLPADARGTRVGYEIGSTGRHRGVATLAPAAGRSFLALEALRDGGYGENRDAARAALNGRLALAASGAGELELVGGAHVGRFGEPGTVPASLLDAGRVGFSGSLSPDTGGRSARAFAALRARTTGEGRRTEATLFLQARELLLQENFTGYLLDAERGDRVEQQHRAVGAGLRLRHERALAERLLLVAGADAAGERIAQHEDRIDAAHVPFARTRALQGLQGTLGARAGLRWLPTSWWKLEGGLRADASWFSVAEPGAPAAAALRPALLPKIAATFYAGDRVTALLAYGRGVRPPEARAVARRGAPAAAGADASAYRGGSARPTVADGLEAGLRARPVAAVELGGGLFATFISREQVFDHLAATNLERNATRRVGVEADVSIRPRDWLHLRVDGTAVDARFVDSGRPVPGAPTLFGTFEAHAAHPSGVLAGARLLALGPRPLAHGARAGAAAIADLVAGYRASRWDASVTVENVLASPFREGEFNYASWFDRAEPRSAIPRLHYAAGPPRVVRVALAARF